MDTRESNAFIYHSVRDPDFKRFRRSESFYEDDTGLYSLKKELGGGRYGKVRLFQHEQNKLFTVIKEVEEEYFNSSEQKFTAVVHGNCRSALSPNAKHRRLEMPFLGKSLGDVMKLLTPKKALRVYLNTLKEVERIHQLGIIHLDLHRYNILVSTEGIIKLCDFGISRKIGSMTADFESFKEGSSHIAPELQIPRPAHPRQDVYSLGQLSRPNTQLGRLLQNLPEYYSYNLVYFSAQMIKSAPEKRPTLPDIILLLEKLISSEEILAAAANEDDILLLRLLSRAQLSAAELHAILIFAIRSDCHPAMINILLSYKPNLFNLVDGQHALIAAVERGHLELIRDVLEKMQDSPGLENVLREIFSKHVKNDDNVEHIQALKTWKQFSILNNFFKKEKQQTIDAYLENYIINLFSYILDDEYLPKFQDIGLMLEEELLVKIINKPLNHDKSLTVLTGAAKNSAFKLVNYLVNDKDCKVPNDFTSYLSLGLIRLLQKPKLNIAKLKYFFSKKFTFNLNFIAPRSELTLKELLVDWLVDFINLPSAKAFCEFQAALPDDLLRSLLSTYISSEHSTLLSYAVQKNPFLIEYLIQYLEKTPLEVNQALSLAFCHLLYLKKYQEAYLLKIKYPKIDANLRHPMCGLNARQVMFRDICHAARCNRIEDLIDIKQLFPKEFLELLKTENAVGNTPLMIAIINSKDEAMTYLLKKEHQPQLEFMQKFIEKGLYAEVHKVLHSGLSEVSLHSMLNNKQSIEQYLFENFLHSIQKGKLDDLCNMHKHLPLLVGKFLKIQNSDNNTVWDILSKQKHDNDELRFCQVYGSKLSLFSIRPNDPLIRWWLDQFNKFKGVAPLKTPYVPKTVSLPYVQIYNWINRLPEFVRPEGENLKKGLNV